jgi:hypothetical protein
VEFINRGTLKPRDLLEFRDLEVMRSLELNPEFVDFVYTAVI